MASMDFGMERIFNALPLHRGMSNTEIPILRQWIPNLSDSNYSMKNNYSFIIGIWCSPKFIVLESYHVLNVMW